MVKCQTLMSFHSGLSATLLCPAPYTFGKILLWNPLQGQPFTVGSERYNEAIFARDFPHNLKTEIYKQESGQWETLQDFPNDLPLQTSESFYHGIKNYGITSTNSKGLTDRVISAYYPILRDPCIK